MSEIRCIAFPLAFCISVLATVSAIGEEAELVTDRPDFTESGVVVVASTDGVEQLDRAEPMLIS